MKSYRIITVIHRALRIFLALLALVALAAHAQNKANELKQRVLPQAQRLGPDHYTYTRTVNSNRTSNGVGCVAAAIRLQGYRGPL
jgi:hypothetical protein